jgi:site-specific DNA recombinase
METIEEKSTQIAALYARVSTGRQEKEETVGSQIEEVKQRIVADGNVLPPKNIFVDDGWTGMMLARPSLDAMRDAIQDGQINIVYVYDLGRLSRDFTDQLILLREFELAEIKFVSLRDINPTTPAEEMMQKVMGIFHDYDRRNTQEKFRRGKLYKARNGNMINGQALYGYRYIKKTDKQSGRWEVDEDEADIVRQIFRWVCVEGLSMHGVIKRLYDRKIYPKKRKRDAWSKGPIVRMLKYKTYFDGIAYYNKSEAVVAKHPIKDVKYKKVKRTSRRVRPLSDWIPLKVPKLFSVDDMFLFDKVQKILEDNKRYASKRRVYDYLLTGKTYCEHGYKRVGDGYSKNSNHYYRSAARVYKFPEKSDCDCAGVNAIVLDKIFWDEFYKILTNPDLMKVKAEKWLKHADEYSESSKSEVADIDKKLVSLGGEGTRYAKMRGEGLIEDKQFRDLMKDVLIRKNRFLEQKEEIKNRACPSKFQNINLNELCQEAQSVIESLDATNKKQIVRELVEKVIIKKGGDEVETWIKILISQPHHMGYGAERRDCWSTKCGEVHTF